MTRVLDGGGIGEAPVEGGLGSLEITSRLEEGFGQGGPGVRREGINRGDQLIPVGYSVGVRIQIHVGDPGISSIGQEMSSLAGIEDHHAEIDPRGCPEEFGDDVFGDGEF